MPLQCGIVGLPNVGKSTIFNALTKSHSAEAQNYPFCTIDPNVGVVAVPDPRFDFLVKIVEPKNSVPVAVEFVDIAGLVKGASQGEGLGNKFLANIRQCDAIVHIVRAFESGDIVHVENDVNPQRDIETINTELILADLQTIDARLVRVQKEAKADPKAKLIYENLLALKEELQAGTPVNLSKKVVQEYIADLHLLTAKPVIYVFNVNEETLVNEAKKNPCVHSPSSPTRSLSAPNSRTSSKASTRATRSSFSKATTSPNLD
jgi:GTP-binding protein YchF